MENGDRIKIHEDIATLKAQMQTVLTNHLPHINTKLNWFFTTMVVGLIGIIGLLLTVVLS